MSTSPIRISHSSCIKAAAEARDTQFWPFAIITKRVKNMFLTLFAALQKLKTFLSLQLYLYAVTHLHLFQIWAFFPIFLPTGILQDSDLSCANQYGSGTLTWDKYARPPTYRIDSFNDKWYMGGLWIPCATLKSPTRNPDCSWLYRILVRYISWSAWGEGGRRRLRTFYCHQR